MPLFKHLSSFELPRNLKAFIRLEAGVVRGRVPEANGKAAGASGFGAGGHRVGSVRPEDITWIFGTARTGSTWLARMMTGLPRHRLWNEPLVGEMFGSLSISKPRWKKNLDREDFVFYGERKRAYLDSVRSFVLSNAAARFPGTKAGDRIVVKEPHGTLGAPILMEALPESRMVFLIRDPRDVAASGIDAHTEGGWARRHKDESDGQAAANDKEDKRAKDNVDSANRRANDRADRYLRDISAAKEAYEAHDGRKTLVRYEDLRYDTLNVMKRVCSDLGMAVEEEKLARSVEKNDWEKIPEEKKGPGRSKRKATPGGWSEDLTPRQIEIVERITAPHLEEFYGS